LTVALAQSVPQCKADTSCVGLDAKDPPKMAEASARGRPSNQHSSPAPFKNWLLMNHRNSAERSPKQSICQSRWDGCRPPQTASQCAKKVVLRPRNRESGK